MHEYPSILEGVSVVLSIDLHTVHTEPFATKLIAMRELLKAFRREGPSVANHMPIVIPLTQTGGLGQLGPKSFKHSTLYDSRTPKESQKSTT